METYFWWNCQPIFDVIFLRWMVTTCVSTIVFLQTLLSTCGTTFLLASVVTIRLISVHALWGQRINSRAQAVDLNCCDRYSRRGAQNRASTMFHQGKHWSLVYDKKLVSVLQPLCWTPRNQTLGQDWHQLRKPLCVKTDFCCSVQPAAYEAHGQLVLWLLYAFHIRWFVCPHLSTCTIITSHKLLPWNFTLVEFRWLLWVILV